jgi:TAT (twin-arginine translocation) pathway signal sequence
MSRRAGHTSRRQFLQHGAALTGAGALGAAAAATPVSAAASAAMQAASKATVVLHDPRLAIDPKVIASLESGGARFVALAGDPVRLWRGAQRELLAHRDTRLFGVTRWPDFLIVRGLAAETRRRVLHEALDPATGVMTWLIA